MGLARVVLLSAIVLCGLSAAVAGGNDYQEDAIASTARHKHGGGYDRHEPHYSRHPDYSNNYRDSGPYYEDVYEGRPYEDEEPRYHRSEYDDYGEHHRHYGGYGSGSHWHKGHKVYKGEKGADGVCTPDRIYTVRSTNLLSDDGENEWNANDDGGCAEATGAHDEEKCAAAKCAFPGDVLVTGSCTVVNGTGRISSPICKDKDGKDVPCEGLGPTPSGWGCTTEVFVTREGDHDVLEEAAIEAVAVCCATALPTHFTINFDDLPTPVVGELDYFNDGAVPWPYRGFFWTGVEVATNGSNALDCDSAIDGIVSAPNVLFGNSIMMSVLPGFVFTVKSLFATDASAADAVATFRGLSGTGDLMGTVNKTVSSTGPTEVNLSGLGRISTLEIKTTACTPSEGTCITRCEEGLSDLAIDNISVTVYPDPAARNTWRPSRTSAPRGLSNIKAGAWAPKKSSNQAKAPSKKAAAKKG